MASLESRANEANALTEKVYEYESRITQMNTKIQTLIR